MLRFPLKKIRKQFKLLLLLVLLTFAVWFTYLHINQGKAIKLHFNYGKDGERQTEGTDGSRKRDPRSSDGHRKSEDTSDSHEEDAAEDELHVDGANGRDQSEIRKFLSQKHKKLPWKPEFKGQANLHVFEDWCGSSVSQLRKNLHFPLFPHTRTVVKKLAVAPKWKNYGLRIFGYIHPYKDGDFQFAVASDDNSEFWLSSDESPLNARLLVYVGQLGSEWTAPGEFTKFRSQASKSVHLIASRRYYFEILHKQDDKGSDHVEVGWRPFLPGLKYEVIDSAYISLYTDESSLKMNSVDHIPQTLASHSRVSGEAETSSRHGADMLKPDPRDTFFKTPMIDPSRLENVLPSCLYSPTYVVKDFPIARYQGLQFVSPKPTHIHFASSTESKCTYDIYLHIFSLYENAASVFFFFTDFLEEEEGVDPEDEAEIVGTPSSKRITRPSQSSHTSSPFHKTGSMSTGEAELKSPMLRREQRHFLHREDPVDEDRRNGAGLEDPDGMDEGAEPEDSQNKNVVHGRSLSWIRKDPEEPRRKSRSDDPPNDPRLPTRGSTTARPPPAPTPPSFNSSENALPTEPPRITSYLRTSEITESQPQPVEAEPEPEEEEGGLSEYSYEEVEPRPGWAEEAINWQRTFSVNSMDFETLRSDWNDLRCNVSGNLQLHESEVVDVLAQYMEKLNERNGGIYTLLRIINVEKRRDSARGNRYLIELELMERGRSVVRLSEYVYLLLHRGRLEDSLETSDGVTASPPSVPQTPSAPSSVQPRATPQWGTVYAKPLLCQPVMLQWKRDVMVHFVVPVKNQARWVQQFISDMELLHRETKDDNFNIIIVDFQSEDMDIEQALRESSVPRYDYLRREGNFERSAGLQIGVDTIEDSHSIVFLCDLHIHFPLNILESIRKHCVEGRLAFAPIVMRLGCGSSPQEPDGYWEVNGFGLFGIYKSDFDKIGGMNTEEFKDRWGGEDWELLDRVLQNGLEVERLRLRNFFHYYHSKRGMWNSQTKKSPKG
uniref:Beta-1,4-N-acetylgalactosaminyltransferase n=1 Tax=Pygocentrus nattereri TaxID=42514 RepID=A0AAR2K5X6_PYGNA